LTDFPSGCAVTQSLNAADDLVSGNTRQSQTGIGSYHRSRIRVTDATGFHTNPNLARPGLRNHSFDNAKTTRRRDFDCSIGFCHLNLPLTFCISRDASSCIVVKLHFAFRRKILSRKCQLLTAVPKRGRNPLGAYITSENEIDNQPGDLSFATNLACQGNGNSIHPSRFLAGRCHFQFSRPQPPAQPDQMNDETDRSQQKRDKLLGKFERRDMNY
jgi:hypothetical protein